MKVWVFSFYLNFLLIHFIFCVYLCVLYACMIVINECLFFLFITVINYVLTTTMPDVL